MKDKGLPKIFIPALVVVGASVVGCIWGGQSVEDGFSWLGSAWLLAGIMFTSLLAYFWYINTLDEQDYNAADSVYYFGFSLTIITLAASSILHFGAGADDLDNLGLVFSQFGIGLVATCLGLVLRLYLVAKLDASNIVDEDSEEKARQKLILDIGSFSTELRQLHENLYQDLQQQQSQFYKKTLNDFKMLSAEVLHDIRDSSKQAIQSIQEHKLLLEQAQIHIVEDALNSFKHRIKSAGEELGEIHEQMNKLDFSSISRDSQQSLGELNQSMKVFSQSTMENTKKLNSSMQQFITATEKSTHYLRETEQDFGNFSQSMNGYRVEVEQLMIGLKATNRELDHHHHHLEQHIQNLNENLQNYSGVYQTYHKVSTDSIKESQEAVNAVVRALTDVAKQATDANTSSSMPKKLSLQKSEG